MLQFLAIFESHAMLILPQKQDIEKLFSDSYCLRPSPLGALGRRFESCHPISQRQAGILVGSFESLLASDSFISYFFSRTSQLFFLLKQSIQSLQWTNQKESDLVLCLKWSELIQKLGTQSQQKPLLSCQRN